MKLAASNLAWPAGADAEAAAVLARHGVTGVELAPGKAWANPLHATPAEAAAVRRWWADRGFAVVAFQALLFGRPDLQVFGSPEVRTRLVEHLEQLARLAADVGAGVLVFGAPKNRRAGDRPAAEVHEVAVEVFSRAGEAVGRHGVVLGIEPNPPEYGCDFVTRVAEAAALVRAVNRPGFGLHLDAGGMHLCGDAPTDAGGLVPVHYHVSEPGLAPVGTTPGVRHAAYVAGLRAVRYDGWLSLEMAEPAVDWAGALGRALGAAARPA